MTMENSKPRMLHCTALGATQQDHSNGMVLCILSPDHLTASIQRPGFLGYERSHSS